MRGLNRRHLILAVALGLLAAPVIHIGARTPATAKNLPVYALITQPIGTSAPTDYAAQLSAGLESGAIADVLLLKSKPSSEGPLGFDSLAVVEFTDEKSYTDWSTRSSAKLGDDMVVRRADIVFDDRAKSHSTAPAYVVSHYEALIPPDQYATYTKDYIKPNMDGQKAGGIMAGYAMFYEREPVPGVKGNRTILLKEYVDEASFDRISEIKAKDKEKLLQNPEWKRINDTKTTLRTDISGTLALPVAMR